MIIVMRPDATPEQLERVCEMVSRIGFEARPVHGQQTTVVGIVGNDSPIEAGPFQALPGVARTIPISSPFKQVSWEWQNESTVVELPNGTRFGGGHKGLIAGPCSVETEEQIHAAAAGVAAAGGTVLRGGAYKPRTSPYSFQGVGRDALVWMRAAADAHGLCVVTEAVDPGSAELVAEHADMIQLGARNMQNYALLSVVGTLGKPVLLKRGMAATIKEWLLAAEYIVKAGCADVVLCERGIRSFDGMTRNVLDLGGMVAAKQRTHLPVVADPSHGTGRRNMVRALSRAAIAAGADGLIVEAHPNPDEAWSDGAQSLTLEELAVLKAEVDVVAKAVAGLEG